MMKRSLLGIWLILLCLWGGCASIPQNGHLGTTHGQVTGFGLIELQTSGPNPRSFPTHLRFFDVVNTATHERTRVKVGKDKGAFNMTLVPGHYEVVRIQINEGPFMAESHVSRKFHINPDVVTYLGKWEFEVDTPRTQRMVKIKISDDRSDWDVIVEKEPKLKDKTVVNSIPDPLEGETRLYAVAPNPKLKYFYRR